MKESITTWISKTDKLAETASLDFQSHSFRKAPLQMLTRKTKQQSDKRDGPFMHKYLITREEIAETHGQV